MTKATPRQRAIGTIGGGNVNRLEAAGLEVNDAGTLTRLKELERDNALLREIVADTTQMGVLAAQVLGEVMGG